MRRVMVFRFPNSSFRFDLVFKHHIAHLPELPFKIEDSALAYVPRLLSTVLSMLGG
jgi:hypothetical protein